MYEKYSDNLIKHVKWHQVLQNEECYSLSALPALYAGNSMWKTMGKWEERQQKMKYTNTVAIRIQEEHILRTAKYQRS